VLEELVAEDGRLVLGLGFHGALARADSYACERSDVQGSTEDQNEG